MSRLLPLKLACLLVVALAGAIASSRASAQDALVPDRADIAGARPQPEYAPSGVQIGPLVVTPAVNLERGYDSNIFGRSDNRVGAAFTVLSPSVGLKSDWGLHGFDLSASATLARYAKYASQNTDEYGFNAGGHADLDGMTASASLSYERIAERRPDNGIALTQGPPSLLNRAAEAIEVTRNLSGIAFSARVSGEQSSYSGLVRDDGSVQSQAFRDLHVWRLQASAAVAPAPTTSLGIEASYTLSSAAIAGGQGSKALRLKAGAVLDLGMARLETEVAYLNHRYDNPLYRDFQGATYRVQVAWYPTPLVTLSASAARGLEPSGAPGSGGVIATSWRLRADYELLRNLQFRGTISERKQSFRDLARTTDSRKLELNGEYSFNHSVAFNAYARHECRSASGTGADVGRRWCAATIGVGLSLRG